MLRILAAATALLIAALAQTAISAERAEPYDLLFRDGTLDDIPHEAVLIYRREVVNALRPEAAARDTGEIALSFAPGGADTPTRARIEFRQEEKHRGLGEFPAGVGNPMIMIFYESVVRDMADAAGGSPFYIRNRMKDALMQPAEVVEGETRFDGGAVPTRTVTLRPFAGDPNRARMQGFGDLKLRVTMSGAVPGWYLNLVAEVPGAEAGTPLYRSAIGLQGMEVAE